MNERAQLTCGVALIGIYALSAAGLHPNATDYPRLDTYLNTRHIFDNRRFELVRGVVPDRDDQPVFARSTGRLSTGRESTLCAE